MMFFKGTAVELLSHDRRIVGSLPVSVLNKVLMAATSFDELDFFCT